MQDPGNPIIKALLAPLSLLYGTGVLIRNLCFDWGIFSSHEFSFPVISVGNLTAGGTGKTPHVEHIVSLLKDEFRVAVLSRGYKRKSSGFVVASTASGVEDVGDEPLQVKKKFPSVEVAVDDNRVRGIRYLKQFNRRLEVFVLDDAFQHRWVKPGINVLLVDYNRQITKDTLLPVGRLREFVSSKRRAAIVIVTKCPSDIKPIERRIITKELSLLNWQSLFFTTFSYCEPIPVFSGGFPFPERGIPDNKKMQILLVTGIVSPDPLKKHLEGITREIEQVTFPDHHQFTKKDIVRIESVWKSMDGDRKLLMTTEKDAMRFQKIGILAQEIRQNMYYIPITVSFIDDKGKFFKNQILQYVRTNKRDHILY